MQRMPCHAFANRSEPFGTDALFAKLYKPNLLGLLLCVATFAVASIALATVVSLWQEGSTTQRMQSSQTVEQYSLGQQSILTLAPGTKLNVVSYANRIELYLLNGAIEARLNEDLPVHIHAGKEMAQAKQGQIAVRYSTGQQPSFNVAALTR